MKIGITCYPTYGGSGVVATELGIELAARGHQVHFITRRRCVSIRSLENISFHEVEVSTYPLFDHAPYTLSLSVKMLEVAQAESLDLLHVHYAIPHSVSALLARSMAAPRRLPFITTLHGTDITLVGNDRSFLPITKFSIEQSDGITCISNYLKKTTIEEFDIQKPIEGDPQFRELRPLSPSQRPSAARRMGSGQRTHCDAPLQFSAGQARHRCGGDLLRSCGRRFAPNHGDDRRRLPIAAPWNG